MASGLHRPLSACPVRDLLDPNKCNGNSSHTPGNHRTWSRCQLSWLSPESLISIVWGTQQNPSFLMEGLPWPLCDLLYIVEIVIGARHSDQAHVGIHSLLTVISATFGGWSLVNRVLLGPVSSEHLRGWFPICPTHFLSHWPLVCSIVI